MSGHNEAASPRSHLTPASPRFSAEGKKGNMIVITGPTATGKTRLGAALCKKLGGEVVSADSMQIYKAMDVGTAKPTPDEMQGVPHHMLSVASPFEPYSVSLYVQEAGKVCEDILSRGKIPVLVGGTGLYIESLISGRDFAPKPADETLRRELEERYDALGGGALLSELAETDPERAEKLHPNDKKRIVRALEIAASGESISAHDEATQKAPPRFNARVIVLNFADRADLYARIDRRVDEMMDRGLLEEVKTLLSLGLTPQHTAMQAIGYKELCAAVEGKCTVHDAINTIKRESRRYAKRQISWCRRYTDALRIDFTNPPDFEKALAASTDFARALV